MLTKISVENYRAFGQRTSFELAPITILLGANSSGKSSITRLFPLFNQSLGVRTSAPILWVTDELDYGSFSDNVTRQSPDKPIEFSLSGFMGPHHIYQVYPGLGTIQLLPSDITYTLSVTGFEDRTFLKGITFDVYGERVRVLLTDEGFIEGVEFGDVDCSSILKDKNVGLIQGMFPTFYSFDKEGSATVASIRDLSTEAIRYLRAYAHQNTSYQTIQKLVSTAYLGTVEETFQSLRSNTIRIPTLQRNIELISETMKRRIWVSLFLASMNPIIQTAQRALAPDITAGSYLAPVRANAERYYRRQELAVDRIDPAGGNLAMYLNSLEWDDLQTLNSDLIEFFDHSVQVRRGEGHISLRLGGRDATFSDNLADVGFGFSQLIPVIAQIYAARRNPRSPARLTFGGRNAPTSPIIAIEQPELHLHPAYQSRLGAYFVRMASRQAEGETRFRFLIETHSEPLVSEVASLIGRGELGADDVRLYLFDQHGENGLSEVVEARIEPDGSIPKWPFGFFSSGRLPQTHVAP
jgi:hypothetical protein